MVTKIYVLCEPDGKIRYVGKTTKTLSQRLSEHISESRGKKRTYKCNWIRYLLSRGYLPGIQLIGEVDGDGCKEEIAWISYFRKDDIKLVNQTDGGEGNLGYKPTKETIEKIRESKRGYICSEATRQRLSKSMMGKPATPGMSGHKHSEETKIKMRNAAMGRVVSQEARIKISEARKGKAPWNKNKHGFYHPSEEIKKKMRTIMMGNQYSKGRICTKEHREKTSKSLKNSPKAILQRFRLHHSDLVRAKISSSLLGHKPWNLGKGKIREEMQNAG